MEKKKDKRNYTIQHNRRITKCPKCKTSIIEGVKCLKCEEMTIVDAVKKLKYMHTENEEEM